VISPHVHIPFSRLSEHLDLIREKSLNLELYFAGDVLDSITPSDVQKAKELLDYNPSLSFHAPFMDLSPGAVDSLVREATMKGLTIYSMSQRYCSQRRSSAIQAMRNGGMLSRQTGGSK
jgi:hypothetical protein